jgi:hypothetical protein
MIRSEIDARIDALERENVTLREAISSCVSGIACHRPMRLGEAQHRALRAVVASAQRDPSQEPFVRPHANHYVGGLKETAVNHPPETRSAA